MPHLGYSGREQQQNGPLRKSESQLPFNGELDEFIAFFVHSRV